MSSFDQLLFCAIDFQQIKNNKAKKVGITPDSVKNPKNMFVGRFLVSLHGLFIQS